MAIRSILTFAAMLATVFAASVALSCAASVSQRSIPGPGPPLPTATPRALQFPADHAPHDADTEWWYYSGHLTGDDNARYGFHVALFRTQGGAAGRTYDRVQASLVDLMDGQHWQWTRDGVSVDGDAEPDAAMLLDAAVGDARLRIDSDGMHHISVADPDSGSAIDLSLSPSDATMLHDGIGWNPFPFGYSYYYTKPRMSASGTIRIAVQETDVAVRVDGEVWYDHQWGDFIVLGYPSGWYWVGLQLDDGASLMLSEVRDTDGRRFRLFGTHLAADGSLRTLDAEADGIALEHREYWTSPETGADYPVSSRIRVESLGLDMTIRPSIVDQETVAQIGGSTSATYWEGSVDAIDSVSGELIGVGYLELAGYVPPDPLSWRDEQRP